MAQHRPPHGARDEALRSWRDSIGMAGAPKWRAPSIKQGPAVDPETSSGWRDDRV